MKRLPNWRARLADEMDRQRQEPFAWGRHDCALGLAAGAVEAITGENLREGIGGYKTPRGALLALRRAGYSSLAEAISARLPEIHPSQAQIGDIGLIPSEGDIGAALCVVDASGVIVMTDHGHGRRPRADMITAYKVG